jgi:hypothetical protein
LSVLMLWLSVFLLLLCVYKGMPLQYIDVDDDIVQSVSTHSIAVSLETA